MAIKQFIDLQNLSLYDSLLKNYVAAEDAKSIKSATIDGYNLKLYTVETPTAQDVPKYNITLPQPDLSNFVEKVVEASNGKALVFNEEDGGGAKFEFADGGASFVGVNNDQNGITAQIYSVRKVDGKNVGTRINVTTDAIYYTNGKSNASYTANDEIATKGDVASISSADKTVYVTEETGRSSDPFSKKYTFYQGDQGSSASPVASEKITEISLAKDMFVESGEVKKVTTPNVPYEGAKVGDYYIDLILANATSDHIYIPANSLVDVYTAAQGATEVQLAIDSNNVISASIVAINGLKLVDGTVTKAKLAQAVQDSLDLGDSALQPNDIDSVADEDIESLFE